MTTFNESLANGTSSVGEVGDALCNLADAEERIARDKSSSPGTDDSARPATIKQLRYMGTMLKLIAVSVKGYHDPGGSSVMAALLITGMRAGVKHLLMADWYNFWNPTVRPAARPSAWLCVISPTAHAQLLPLHPKVNATASEEVLRGLLLFHNLDPEHINRCYMFTDHINAFKAGAKKCMRDLVEAYFIKERVDHWKQSAGKPACCARAVHRAMSANYPLQAPTTTPFGSTSTSPWARLPRSTSETSPAWPLRATSGTTPE